MIDPRVVRLLRDNRQMRLHVLFVLWMSDRPLGVAEIAETLNVNRDTIGDWLGAMAADGYVSRVGGGRWGYWMVTDKVRQLPLPGAFLTVDAEKKPASDGSSSGFSSANSVYDQLTTTTTTTTDAEKARISLTSGPEFDRLVDVLRENMGIPLARAEAVVSTVIEHNWGVAWLEYHAWRWLDYCLSEAGKGIQNVGFFIAKRLQEGEGSPVFHRVKDYEMSARLSKLWRALLAEEAAAAAAESGESGGL